MMCKLHYLMLSFIIDIDKILDVIMNRCVYYIFCTNYIQINENTLFPFTFHYTCSDFLDIDFLQVL